MSEEVSVLNLLNEIKSGNTSEHTAIANNIDGLCKTITEHNGRLRKVEVWQATMAGAIAIIGLIVSGVVFPMLVKSISAMVQ